VSESGELGAVLVQGDQLVQGVVCDEDTTAIRTDCTSTDSVLSGLVTVQLSALAVCDVINMEAGKCRYV